MGEWKKQDVENNEDRFGWRNGPFFLLYFEAVLINWSEQKCIATQ